MNKELLEQINKLTKEGWKLCAGCIPSPVSACANCPIETDDVTLEFETEIDSKQIKTNDYF